MTNLHDVNSNPYDKSTNVAAFTGRGQHFGLGSLEARLTPWVPAEQARIVDVGAGSGNYSLKLLNWFPNAEQIIALEPSSEMLVKLKDQVATRRDKVRVVAGSAQELPLASASVDAAWISLALHYIIKPNMSAAKAAQAVANIARVVGREDNNGIVAIRGTFADESEHLQNLCSLFGAETVKASAQKCFPTLQETVDAFGFHGFSVADKSVVEVGRAQTRQEYVDRCLVRGGSTLFRNMPDAAFASGVANAEQWAAAAPGAGPVMTAHTVLILERPAGNSRRFS